jgi:hypothetical protein
MVLLGNKWEERQEACWIDIEAQERHRKRNQRELIVVRKRLPWFQPDSAAYKKT